MSSENKITQENIQSRTNLTATKNNLTEKEYDPAVVGKGKPGPGRPKGALNKTTMEKREWVSKLLDDREQEIEDALTRLAKEDPDKALKHLLGLLEYTTPKLARSEIVGYANQPVALYLVNRLTDPEQEISNGEDDGQG